MFTRRLLLAASTASLLTRPAILRAAEYPDRPITLVIGYAPGALTDVMVRLVAEKMAQELGQPVVVENRTGAATAIASTAVANARPDGYTLLIGTNSLAINPALLPGATPKDPLTELEPIGEVYYSPFALLARRGLPANNLAELIALARQKPGELNYGSSGSGSVNHLLTELLLQRSGMEIVHIPYRGGAPALVELRSGRIDLFYATPLDSQPLLRDGVAHPILMSSPQRIPMMPDVPSVAESFEGCTGVLWQGLFSPPGTPAPIRERLFTVLRKVIEAPELRQNVASRGVVLMDGDAAALRRRLAEEMRIWPEVIRQGGITPG
ncbi:Bug family tripartite tricarboxylate transporter substrate binding protein [Siccirubricoccus phaeus]|uniref:Bug family tripartite tricarboxylate transporter substrate binding protein n=1 Tax=Siccirubricoccus phaeus TaxID=2595053 RepID=UPI0011F38CFE|nr:tripartite tricarboxylate transporter substrate-binding protein [Siccirubricoccus phaeus]